LQLPSRSLETIRARVHVADPDGFTLNAPSSDITRAIAIAEQISARIDIFIDVKIKRLRWPLSGRAFDTFIDPLLFVSHYLRNESLFTIKDRTAKTSRLG